MALMRWLRPRMPAVRRLRLELKCSLHASHSRFDSRCETALHVLADRLAAAAVLQELSVYWDVERGGAGGNDGDAPLASSFPLDVALMLPAQSRTARRARRPLELGLKALHLSCAAGCMLRPQLGRLPQLEQLTLGPGW